MPTSRKKLLLWVAAAAAVLVTSLLCCAGAGGFSGKGGGGPALTTPVRNGAPNRSPIGTNLANFSYWSQNHPFVDAMKAADGFISGRPEHPDAAKRWNDGSKLALSEHGWVTKLEPGQVARVFIIGGDTSYPTGRYAVLYEGQGDIEYQGRISNLQRTPGRDTFDLGPDAGLFLNITRVDEANPLRNIRILLPGGSCEDDAFKLCENDAGCGGRCVPFEESYQRSPFHPTFLSDIREFGILRFMDWMQTNRERVLKDGVDEPLPIREYAEYPTRAHAQWHPVPVEVMVELSNLLGADPWFTIPHQASDDFVRRFATEVNSRIKPDRKVYVEYSNEHWNDLFDQHQWMSGAGCQAESPSPKEECDPNGDGELCEYATWDRFQVKCDEYGNRFFARRTVEVTRIFSEVFGKDASQRLVRILGGQIGAAQWRGKPQLEQVVDGRPVDEQVDAYAVAPYFGGDALKSVEDAFIRVEEETNGAPAGTFQLLSGEATAEWGGLFQWIAKDAATLSGGKLGGVRLIAYEGGQHFHSHEEAKMALMITANRDPRMGEVYAGLLQVWSELTDGAPFVHFTSPAAWGRYGAWGSKEFQGQPLSAAPKHAALLKAIEQQRAGRRPEKAD